MRIHLNSAFVALFLAIVLASQIHAADFFVSPTGSDCNSGSREQPFGSLESARNAARKAGGINRIYLKAGDFLLTNSFTLDQRDSGLTITTPSGEKATIYGGKTVSGWRRDGENFWSADLPEVAAGQWDFRMLVVNGRMAEHARLPESGTLFHRSKYDVKWLSSAGGGWARPPTKEESTTLLYDPKDIPFSFEPLNAEVRVYHMWDESLVGVVANDARRHALILQMARKPPGAFGVSNYVVFNTREGMTHPGQWYLDRAAGRVVYWPLPNEDMRKAKVIAPVLARVIVLLGTTNSPVENILLRGFSVQATTTPLKFAGFAAENCDGAVSLENAHHCRIENLEIANVGGDGIKAVGLDDCQISSCLVHHAGGTGIWAEGADFLIASNHLHDIGKIHLSAVGVHADHNLRPDANGFHLYRNEISDVSYCGVHGLGGNNLLDENLIYRVMLEMHDGGAIYGMMRNTFIRNNFVRDVVKPGPGFDVPAYYLDESSENCTVEHNVSMGVEVPTHNHIARNITLRDNVFTTAGDMRLTFSRSENCNIEGNILCAGGTISVTPPIAINTWTNNVLYQYAPNGGGGIGGAIDAARPAAQPPRRGLVLPLNIVKAALPPTIDGNVSVAEWGADWVEVNRDPSGWPGLGAPAFVSLAYDDSNLYVAVKVILMDINRLQPDGDDEVTIAVGGNQGVLVLRGCPNEKFNCTPQSGATAEAATRLSNGVRYAASFAGQSKGDFKSSWQCEWAIPFNALGIKPDAGKTLPFNLGIHRNEDGGQRYLESPQGEIWQLDQTTELKLK